MFLGLSVVDWVIILLALAAAFTGWRNGLVVGLLSLVGFVGGAFLGLWLVPKVLSGLQWGLGVSILAVGLVLVVAFIVQGVLTATGGLVRAKVARGPVRMFDAVTGAVLAVVGLLVASWAVGVAASTAAIPTVSTAVRESKLLPVVDEVIPVSPDQLREGFSDGVAAGGFPKVVVPWATEPIPDVAPPTGVIGRVPEVRQAADSVVNVVGEAQRCDRVVSGSGFVAAPQRIMTNAHVVAGVEEPVVTHPEGDPLAAQVVYTDPQLDVAVLHLPNLDLPPLSFAEQTPPDGTDVAVVGYPRNGPRSTEAARIRGTTELLGRDIYDEQDVARSVISLRGSVRPGNSGGPVLNESGQVLGVVFAASLTNPDAGYALNQDALDGAMDAVQNASEPVPTGECT